MRHYQSEAIWIAMKMCRCRVTRKQITSTLIFTSLLYSLRVRTKIHSALGIESIASHGRHDSTREDRRLATDSSWPCPCLMLRLSDVLRLSVIIILFARRIYFSDFFSQLTSTQSVLESFCMKQNSTNFFTERKKRFNSNTRQMEQSSPSTISRK